MALGNDPAATLLDAIDAYFVAIVRRETCSAELREVRSKDVSRERATLAIVLRNTLPALVRSSSGSSQSMAAIRLDREEDD